MHRFTFARYRFTLQPETTLRLPGFKGSAFRGGFGMAFRRAVCIQRRSHCTDCLLRRECVYSRVFETPVPPDSELMRKYAAAPHPFVIEPPETGQSDFDSSDRIVFHVTLVGQAAEYLPYFIFAFEQLGRRGFGSRINGRRGRYRLLEVRQAAPAGDNRAAEQVVYQGESGTLLSSFASAATWADLPLPPAGEPLVLTFHTPVRIKYQGRFADQLDFHILFRNLLRRISMLSYFHCGHRLDDSGFAELVRSAQSIRTADHALRWQEQRRWSGRQKTSMKMGGLVGTVSYEGDLGPFLPYIALGRHIHCGKGCTFGLGRYTIA